MAAHHHNVCDVHVYELSNGATEDHLLQFFGFCGVIRSVTIERGTNGAPGRATVIFADPKSVDTALLLTGAVIVDRAVVIAAAVGPPTPATVEGGCSAFLDSAETVVVTLLAHGFTLGANALAKAREFDERHAVTARTRQAAASAEAAAAPITQAATAGARTIAGVAEVTVIPVLKQVDQKYGVWAAASQMSDWTNKFIVSTTAQAMANPGVQHVMAGAKAVADKANDITQRAFIQSDAALGHANPLNPRGVHMPPPQTADGFAMGYPATQAPAPVIVPAPVAQQ